MTIPDWIGTVMSIESFRSPAHPVHRCLLEGGAVVLEGSISPPSAAGDTSCSGCR